MGRGPMGRTARPRRLLAPLGALAVALAACGAPEARTLPPPSSTSSTAPEAPTSSIDLSQVEVPRVPGETTTTLESFGDAILAGVVGGPEGNLAGAVVRVERLVGDASQVLEVRTAEDGTWALEGLPGGRFRIRAYQAPELTQVDPVVLFLGDGETRELTLTVAPFVGTEVVAGTTPAAPIVGDVLTLAVRVGRRVVGTDGVGRVEPLVGVAVRVLAVGWDRVDGGPDPEDDPGPGPGRGPGRGSADDDPSDDGASDPDAGPGEPDPDDPDVVVTDEDGIALLTFRCPRVGPVAADAVVGPDGEVFALDVPPCAPRPTTTTSTTTTTAPDDDG